MVDYAATIEFTVNQVYINITLKDGKIWIALYGRLIIYPIIDSLWLSIFKQKSSPEWKARLLP